MSRLMSVSLTERAVVERRKTVTRRLGWTFLKPGDRLTLCRKVMGRKPGEPLVRLADVEVVSVRRERLMDMDKLAMSDARINRHGTLALEPATRNPQERHHDHTLFRSRHARPIRSLRRPIRS